MGGKRRWVYAQDYVGPFPVGNPRVWHVHGRRRVDTRREGDRFVCTSCRASVSVKQARKAARDQ